MRIFAVKLFHKWTKKNGLSHQALLDAVKEIEKGLVDADLGSNIYKKRIATRGRGKSSSIRTVLAYSSNRRTVFLYGFEKNQRANIKDSELKMLKRFGAFVLKMNEDELSNQIRNGSLFEIK